MKRDVDLVRQILLNIEHRGAACPLEALRADLRHESDERIRCHLQLAIDAGRVAKVDRSAVGLHGVRLTHAGHEFIEVARGDARWRAAKAVVIEETGGQSLTMLRSLLTKWAWRTVVHSERHLRPRRGYRRYVESAAPAWWDGPYVTAPAAIDDDQVRLVRRRRFRGRVRPRNGWNDDLSDQSLWRPRRRARRSPARRDAAAARQLGSRRNLQSGNNSQRRKWALAGNPPPAPIFIALRRPIPTRAARPYNLGNWPNFAPIRPDRISQTRERQFTIMRTIRHKLSRAAIPFFSVIISTSTLIAAPQAPETPLAAPPTVADKLADHPSPPDTIDLRDYVVLPAVGHYGRLAVQQDSVEAELISGQWKSPIDGETIVTIDGGTKLWRAATAKDDTLDTRALRGGYAFAKFDSPVDRVMLLEAEGHAAVYVNGELHTGDPYNLGWLRLPVLVHQGENTLLFHLAGDQLTARLTKPPSGVYFMTDDRTLPTLVRGETETVLGALPVVNASRDWLKDLQLECTGGGSDPLTTPVAPIPPLSIRKIAFQIPAGHDDGGEKSQHTIRLLRTTGDKAQLSKSEIELKRVGAADIQIRTFRSRIDGSVQPYAARAAIKHAPTGADRLPSASDDSTASAGAAALPGMLVTLHDAAVDCEDQVALFEPKTWAHIVAPTGRRPYGFDWEDWGRIDVLEVLNDASKRYPGDPSRTYLTGHSMGGHGTWHLGVTYPDLFSAIGPSGAWASFWSYGGGMPTIQNPSKLEELELRSYLPSDTVQLLGNLTDTGVYVLHGAQDETVPVAQARFMRSRLAAFHGNFAYYEKPGAEHSWGSDSCDWAPMMQFFERLARPAPESRPIVDFATADPGVSSRCDWLTIEVQQEPLKLSHAVVRQDVDTRTFVGQTTNVARLAIDVSHLAPGQTIDVTLDGQQLEWIPWPEENGRLWFEHHDKQWRNASPPSSKVKGPERAGTFKSAFDHGALLVYGTGGTDEENRWAESKSRYDAETFWYRGGGSLEILRDADFDPVRAPGRNVILYGNADTNSAWMKLLADCPVQVQRGQVRVGDRTESGDDLGVLMVFPRAGTDSAAVGVVAGTGPIGMRLTSRLRYFVSGIAYPDFVLLDTVGAAMKSPSIRSWGYFGPEWTIEAGDIAWRVPTP